MASDGDKRRAVRLISGLFLLLLGGGLVLSTLFFPSLWLYAVAFLALWEGLRQTTRSWIAVDSPARSDSPVARLGYALAAVGMCVVSRQCLGWAERLSQAAVQDSWATGVEGMGALSALLGLLALAKAVLPGPGASGNTPSAANDRTARSWQKVIISDSEAKLKRPLREYERRFIECRGGFIALEMIHDTVKAADAGELERYLGSERGGPTTS